jgi:hypothetical protein
MEDRLKKSNKTPNIVEGLVPVSSVEDRNGGRPFIV